MRQLLDKNSLDFTTIMLYLLLVVAGWLNIYAAEYDPEVTSGFFSFSNSAGRQFIWIMTSLVIAAFIYYLDYKIFESLAYIIYAVLIALLLVVLLSGKEIAGSKSWFGVGGFGLQPSEFAKYATSIALAKYFSNPTLKIEKPKTLFVAFAMILLSMALIIMQGDTGTALVFSSLLIPLFREGMPPTLLIIGLSIAILFILTILLNTTILLIGIGVVLLMAIGLNTRNLKRIMYILVIGFLSVVFIRSVNFILHDVLRTHQQKRIMSLVNPNIDPLGIGWNVTQSKIAIGSGGFGGKGYLQGTQTKFDFVPEQTTDFIFCTIGEEHGWVGSVFVVIIFVLLFLRLIQLAERQKSRFARFFGYSVFGILFFHFTVNIAMTIGLFPVIGIPLPFFSYGGSSLWSFSLMLFTFLKLDSNRMQELQRF